MLYSFAAKEEILKNKRRQKNKRCQAPNSGIMGNMHSYRPPLPFFGRPRRRSVDSSVDSRRSCLAVLAIHATVEHMKNHSTRGISCWSRHARILPNLPTIVKFHARHFFLLIVTIDIADNFESVGYLAVTLHDSPVSVGGIGCPFVKPMPNL